MWDLVVSSAFLAVATTGTSVFFRRWRASWKPIPRDAGVTRAHGFDILRCREGGDLEERYSWRRGWKYAQDLMAPL